MNDLTGKRFGRLLVLRGNGHHLTPSGSKHRLWICRCDCGEERSIIAHSLLRGATISCGCAQKELAAAKKRTHGLHGSHEHKSWSMMKQRCLNPQYDGYEYYGLRGIKVCARWLVSFENFYADMGPRPSPKHSIDRIDLYGDYCPENCRWATPVEQARNTRRSRWITIRGETKTLAEWSEISGIGYRALRWRISAGWDPERAISEPVAVAAVRGEP